MGGYGINSGYISPALLNLAIQQLDELLAFPGHDWKCGVTLAAGNPVINVGDILTQITTGADTGKYRKQMTGEPALCIAARPVQPANYNYANPAANTMLDVDFQIDAIFKGYVKASRVNGDVSTLQCYDLRPYQDVLIVR